MKVKQSTLPGQIITIYTPVVFTDGPRTGELAVQITSPEGHFLGWADGLGKYDKQGKWEICDKWSPEQAAEYGRAISRSRDYSTVTIVEDGVQRIVTSTL